VVSEREDKKPLGRIISPTTTNAYFDISRAQGRYDFIDSKYQT